MELTITDATPPSTPKQDDGTAQTRAVVVLVTVVVVGLVLTSVLLATAIWTTVRWSSVVDRRLAVGMVSATWLGMFVIGPIAPIVSFVVWQMVGSSLPRIRNAE